MNRREKEQYLREYSVLKNQGKPFFPYAVAKDGAMACVVLLAIIVMSLMFGAELGPKADPTTTTYVPRPEWYFFFLFELLRIIKPPELVPLATIGVPTICMILLFLLPFDQRSYWATIVGVNINGTGPLVGPFLSDFLRGGAEFGATTLSRFYAIHMLMLPALMLIFMGIHLYLVVRLGITPLPQKLDEAYDRVKSEGN